MRHGFSLAALPGTALLAAPAFADAPPPKPPPPEPASFLGLPVAAWVTLAVVAAAVFFYFKTRGGEGGP